MPYTIDPNDNTQSNFVYVGSGFDHQLSYIFQTMKLLVGIHTNSWRRHQGWHKYKAVLFCYQVHLGHTFKIQE
jgi:hypothetical protein